MILIENTQIEGWETAIRGMRNPMNSWNLSDSAILHGDDYWGIDGMPSDSEFVAEQIAVGHRYDKVFIGPKDHDLMMRLAKAGSTDAKYRRMLVVSADITAPLYWWKEYDTYKVGTVANSCSTMHKIAAKAFSREDFSMDHLLNMTSQSGNCACNFLSVFDVTIAALNVARDLYLATKDKTYWWQMIQLLPSSYNQRRTVMLNYEVLAGIYPKRKDHKLDEWHVFCDWIKSLPYSEIITLEDQT